MTDLLFREWDLINVDIINIVFPSDLCSVYFEPSPLLCAVAAEYRKDAVNVDNSPHLKTSKRTSMSVPTIATIASANVEAERERLRAAHKDAFDDGFRTGALGSRNATGTRLPGGYPIGFFDWSLAARNAWFAGHYAGLAHAKKLKDGAA